MSVEEFVIIWNANIEQVYLQKAFEAKQMEDAGKFVTVYDPFTDTVQCMSEVLLGWADNAGKLTREGGK